MNVSIAYRCWRMSSRCRIHFWTKMFFFFSSLDIVSNPKCVSYSWVSDSKCLGFQILFTVKYTRTNWVPCHFNHLSLALAKKTNWLNNMISLISLKMSHLSLHKISISRHKFTQNIRSNTNRTGSLRCRNLFYATAFDASFFLLDNILCFTLNYRNRI